MRFDHYVMWFLRCVLWFYHYVLKLFHYMLRSFYYVVSLFLYVLQFLHYVVQFLHYVVRFLRYVVSPLCVVVLPLCNVILFLAIRVYFRCQSLFPRFLSSLRTRLTGLLYKILCVVYFTYVLPFCLSEKKIMEDILKELHLESLIPHFSAERIQPANVAALSDEDLCHVGETTIGDRLRLRDLCAIPEKELVSL